jgi:thymidylate synthase (FAD)
MKIDVLDTGFVRLVRSSGGDIDVVRAARVSFDADWRTGEDEGSDERLIRYLMKNHHTSPFEHVVFTFEVKAPIFVFRQWHRHRTWSYSEVSARYAELDEGYYLPDAAVIGAQSADNKQARDILDTEQPYANTARAQIKALCDHAFGVYRDLLSNGVPRELARSVLPVAAYSRMFATVDLHNLMGFLRLRLHNHAQWEIQQYAKAIMALVEPIVPVTMAAFKETEVVR